MRQKYYYMHNKLLQRAHIYDKYFQVLSPFNVSTKEHWFILHNVYEKINSMYHNCNIHQL